MAKSVHLITGIAAFLMFVLPPWAGFISLLCASAHRRASLRQEGDATKATMYFLIDVVLDALAVGVCAMVVVSYAPIVLLVRCSLTVLIQDHYGEA